MLRLAFSAATLLATAALTAPAQMVVSAHSGTLHYFEGDVSIDGVAVKAQPGHFDQMKEQSVLRTGRGRAEVLLTPGVFLRVGENSAIRLLDNRLASTRVELMSGSATLEADTNAEAQGKYKMTPVTVIYKDYQIQPTKDGLFEISTDPAQVRAYKGDALVEAGSNRATVKDGREMFLTAALATDKFDPKTSADDNYLWARDRSAQLSAANMSSARTVANNSNSWGGYGLGSYWGSSLYGGGWYFNPLFNMYTYMPLDGYALSPFGYGFYSPMVIGAVYMPSQRTWYGGGGARTTGIVGRPVSGMRGLVSGNSIATAATRPTAMSPNVISSRATGAVISRSGGAMSRGGASAGGGGLSAGGRPSAASLPSGGGMGGGRVGGASMGGGRVGR